MNEVKIKTNVLNIHDQVSTYKTHSNRIMNIYKFDEVQYFTKAVSQVIDAGNEIRCIYDAYIEKRKNIEQSSTINISTLTSQKFVSSETDRFIHLFALSLLTKRNFEMV